MSKISDYITAFPEYGTGVLEDILPTDKLRKNPITPEASYRLVKDELLDEGVARQNLATFCQTFMEPNAVRLMSETLEKNSIDKSEYPQTARLEQRCVNIIADLWNAQEGEEFTGTSTVGSSEAGMLSGLAMKFRWRENALKQGLDINMKKPNLVISSGYQICWEKFCVYWDVELRAVPMDEDNLSLNLDEVMDYVDEYTIGIVGILGITYTGKLDDIRGLNDLVESYNQKTEFKVYIHVDGASGGMFTPFVNPEKLWDFRLKNVVSINTSGHKYGLVYPGIGWVVWRDKKFLPEELIFEVSYLGGSMPTMALNFSRSASPIIGQYYNFTRFGFDGYRAIHEKTSGIAKNIAKELEDTGLFKLHNDGKELPIVCWSLKEDKDRKWNLYDLADRIRMRGWQVPAYPLPENIKAVIVQRVVIRADLNREMGKNFIEDFKRSIDELDNARIICDTEKTEKGIYGFTH
ncbi:MAG: glutamate decarboxylase [Anaerovoracaceae bacterium]